MIIITTQLPHLVLILWWIQLGQGGDRMDTAPSRVPPPAASNSSHPRLPTSPAIDLDIFCLPHPNDSPSQHIFSVTLHSYRTIDGLKKVIKQERGNNLKDIDAMKLTLYKVFIATAVFRHTALSLLLTCSSNCPFQLPSRNWRLQRTWNSTEVTMELRSCYPRRS